MRIKWIIAVAVLQVLVLAYMAGEREWVLRTLGPLITEDVASTPENPKSALQEIVQAEGLGKVSDDAGLLISTTDGRNGRNTDAPPPESPPGIENYYYDSGPPVVTYYPPPWDYGYLYSWT